MGGDLGKLPDGLKEAEGHELIQLGVLPATQDSPLLKVCEEIGLLQVRRLLLSSIAKDAESGGSPLPSASKSE